MNAEVKGKDKNGKEVVVYVKKPNYRQLQDAQFHANKAFNIARKSGAVLRDDLTEWLKEEGYWSESKQKKLEELGKFIDDGEKILYDKKKTKVKKLSEAEQLAKEMFKKRLEYFRLVGEFNKFDEFTLEGQTENAKFDYLVSVCVYDEEGEKVFESVEDYLDRADEDFASRAASKLHLLMSNIKEDWTQNLPENKFLKKYGFLDEEGRFIDKDGNYVDEQGNRIDDEGYLINEDGERVDEEGNLIVEFNDEDFAEFEDDVYNKVEDSDSVETEED